MRPGEGAIKRKSRAHTTQRLLVEAIIRLGGNSSIEDSDHGFAHLDRISGDRIWKLSGLSAGIAKNMTMQKELKMSNAISEAPQSFAVQFAADSADRLNARRNMRLGLWAGSKLGLPEESCAVYALEVMVAGMIDSGHDDVVDKIKRDFTKQGIPMTRRQILAQLSEGHHLVTTQRVISN
jgi:hypothetical protein